MILYCTLYSGNPSSISSLSQLRAVTLKLIVSLNLPKSEENESEPLITGLDFLSDGRLVAVDNLNRKCMLLNEGLRRLGTPYTLKSSSPKDVAVLSNSEIVVTSVNFFFYQWVQTMSSVWLSKLKHRRIYSLYAARRQHKWSWVRSMIPVMLEW